MVILWHHWPPTIRVQILEGVNYRMQSTMQKSCTLCMALYAITLLLYLIRPSRTISKPFLNIETTDPLILTFYTLACKRYWIWLKTGHDESYNVVLYEMLFRVFYRSLQIIIYIIHSFRFLLITLKIVHINS